ncbi:hypothetical protein FRC12_016476 [Ceratobasidium sp. 428]|nr:hypothetical protein FRC12_016476 [Ceratobasidium sp. 428]
MDEEDTGRPKRLVTKTKAIAEFDKACAKSAANRDSRQRTKNIRAEEAALTAVETEAIESPKKTKSKKKNTKSKKAADDKVDDPILAELNADAAKAERFKNIIHYRDIIPYDVLNMVDYEDLEAFYLAGDGAAKVLLTIGPHAKPPKPNTSKAAAKAPPVAKTPAPKKIAAIVMPATIKSLGSPINALASAKKQSARVADTPIAATRKRASSTDRGGTEPKRQRMAALENIKPSKSNGNRSVSGPASMSASHAASSSLNKGLHSMSRQSSRAPSASRAGSQAPRSSAAVPTSGPAFADPDSEMLGPSDLDEEMEDAVEEKPKKKRAAPGQGKDRARRGHYQGLEQRILDETLSLVCARLGSDNACPTGGNFERLIRACWVQATKNLETTPEKYPCDQYHVRVTTDRVSSYRSHAKRNIQNPAVLAYGLNSLAGKDLENHVKYLIKKKKYYKGDKVEGRSGLYEHPLVIHALRQLFFVGRKASAIRFPDDYNPVPPNALATAVAILQFTVQQHRTGQFVEEKLEFDTLYKLWHRQLENVHFWMEQVGEKIHVKVRTLLYDAALNGSGKNATVPSGDDENRLTLSDLEGSSDDDEPTLALRPTSGFKAAPSSSKPSGSSKSKSSKPSSSVPAPASSEPGSSSNKLTSSKQPKPQPKPKPKPKLSTVAELPSSPSSSPSSPPPSKPPPSKPSPPSPALPEAPPSKPGHASKGDSSSSESSSESSDSKSGSDSSESESESESESDTAAATKSTGPSRKSAQASPAPKVVQQSPASKGTGGAPKPRLSAAAPNHPGRDSSDLSDAEDDADTGTGKGPKRREENMDVDSNLDEGVEKPEKQGEEDEEDSGKNGGNVASPSDSIASRKSGRKATKQATEDRVETDGSPKKNTPTKESSSVQPSTKALVVGGDEPAKEVPKAKGRKTKEKKAKESKGKEKDPGEDGTWTGISTRSSRKSA